MIDGDPARAAQEIGSRSAKDGESYVRFRAFLDRLSGVTRLFHDEPPVDLLGVDTIETWRLIKRAFRLRGLGRGEMMEVLRLPSMSVADWLDEWFENGTLKAALALPAIAGTRMGPRSPTSAFNLLLRETIAGVGLAAGSLAPALEKAARAQGVEIRTEAKVDAIVAGAHRIEGVVLEGGETIEAPIVAASCDPKQLFLRLLPPGSVTQRLARHVRQFRSSGTTAQVLLALDAPPRFSCRPDAAIERAVTGGDLDSLERAHDAIKYRRFSGTPILDIHVPTVSSPDLAPQGHSIVSILVHFAPRDLEPGWDDAHREKLGERVREILESHAPGLSSSIVSGQVTTPEDIETRYGITGGHIHHGEHTFDQLLVRPVPGCSSYSTPIPGLFLCGSGSHPGGGITCAPGSFAAEAILKVS
jgi:phytoene dehydrogenase-like protein